MKTEKQIPTQFENPKGLHQRYSIRKLVIETVPERNHPTYRTIPEHQEIREVDVDENAEYFVMRLDEGGSDLNHVNACRIGIHAYADAIEATIPQLAKDLRERYPILQV